MNYREAVGYLDSFINYEKIGYRKRRTFKLKRMQHFTGIFNNPQKSFQAIHISGTKGKGSVASFVSTILKEANFKTGLYTSPHLVTPRERIKINNEMIEETDLAFYTDEIKKKLEKENLGFSPTFFEVYTLLAFNYFKKEKIDYGVIEVGLGGRLDATNIIHPLVSCISSISYDHIHVLGKSLKKIAQEKSGIIKRDCIAVSAPQEDEALEVIKKRCKSLNVELVLIGKDISFDEVYHDDEKEIFSIQGTLEKYEHCQSRLLGRHQILNASCAIGIIESLIKKGEKIKKEAIEKGIEKTENPGRCEVIARCPYVILDGAQNRKSAEALKETIKRNFNYERLILILGISKGKDIKGVCGELAPLADMVILTRAQIERAEEPRLIGKFIKGKKMILTDSVKEALRKACAISRRTDLILVTGSFFVLSEIYEKEGIAI